MIALEDLPNVLESLKENNRGRIAVSHEHWHARTRLELGVKADFPPSTSSMSFFICSAGAIVRKFK